MAKAAKVATPWGCPSPCSCACIELLHEEATKRRVALGDIYLRASLSPAEIAQLPDWAVSRFCDIQQAADAAGAR